ncbi:hypothetical protein Slala05_79200 [Streptomyces lavendulae subsp. lavendulae]|nr:hypothetical protein Slala05_79200 [Streptomyces lavendulae subsp. lavendulae]
MERGLRALSRPDPSDGVVELRSRRRTKPGGLGTTAERRVRVLSRQEAFVWVPVVAAELLEPRQLRAWAALAYAEARGVHVSEAQLGEVLVHHSGKRAGQAIGAGAASAVVDSLEGLGWLRVHRREGRQGRHVYEVLERPALVEPGVEPGCDQAASVEQGAGCSGVGDGSGSRAGDGSLATEEDLQIDGLVDEGGLISSAVGEAEVVAREAPVENPQSSCASASSSGGLALRADENSLPAPELNAAQRGAYSGPELTFSTRLAWVMEPVAWLVQRVPAFVQRSFARQLGAQLAEGVEPERLRARLRSRFARTSPTVMRSVEGWLLKVAAVRWGCHDPRCEEGVRWHSGEQCAECLAVRLERRAARDRQQLLEAGVCPDCRSRLAEDGRCWACRPAPAPRPTPTVEPEGVVSPGPERGAVDGLPCRCPDCGSWAEGRTDGGRCPRCAVQFAVREAEVAAMDAASAGLLAGEKLAAAARACAEVRRRVAAAREAAIAAGLDRQGQDVCAVAAAEEAARSWTATHQLVGAA